ncbi:STAS domain-containing protein [Ornithinibacillus sp. L9]|uniref:STAS domain-containing protein n=1 Tax=Ornithinibacillus caprae TaxID=2678566 RepID=A0A6N8FGF6_9BACI|nr:STAS domain-containing protein [Ornithinibacillus caprae]MUK88535.1 STAS domain-containing protein [Ornithinibacillus caprae]
MSNKQSQFSIGELDFHWNLDKGRLQFENDDAVLFWIESAMGTLIDTIEEISGEDASNLVLETTGFRQGFVVGEYFQKMKEVTVTEAAELVTNTYAAAGWGKFNIHYLDMQEKKVTVHLKDSWEHKIYSEKGGERSGILIPAHFAGIFTALFETNIWYDVEHYQIEGYNSTVVHYEPSDITVTDNIHRLAREKELDEIMKLEALVEDKTRELEALITKLSSPIIPVLEGIVVIPLLGKYEEKRSEELLEKTLNNLPPYKADYLLLDLTGLDENINNHTVSLIERLGSSISLLGIKTILVGISPKLSRVMVQLGVNLSDFDCFHSLQHGIHYALGQMGRSIIKTN